MSFNAVYHGMAEASSTACHHACFDGYLALEDASVLPIPVKHSTCDGPVALTASATVKNVEC